MIWVFDSWFWGLQTLRYLKKEFPNLDYLFYADNKNVPYWDKSGDEIMQLTFKWLNYLFDNWAKLVILACNTASAYSIKEWQAVYPEKKVLSITIPGVEKVIENWYKKVWLLATDATVRSDIYLKKYCELNKNCSNIFYSVWSPKIVDLIEAEVKDEGKIKEVLKSYLDKFPKDIEALILGCTHYPIYIDYFKELFFWDIIDPSLESVLKLRTYFEKHKELYDSISKNGEVTIVETAEHKKMEM